MDLKHHLDELYDMILIILNHLSEALVRVVHVHHDGRLECLMERFKQRKQNVLAYMLDHATVHPRA